MRTTDVYDLDGDDRISLADLERYNERDTFANVGIDDFTSVDTVLRMNGETCFVTSAH